MLQRRRRLPQAFFAGRSEQRAQLGVVQFALQIRERDAASLPDEKRSVCCRQRRQLEQATDQQRDADACGTDRKFFTAECDFAKPPVDRWADTRFVERIPLRPFEQLCDLGATERFSCGSRPAQVGGFGGGTANIREV